MRKSRKSSRRGIGREKSLGMPRQEGKTSRKSQGRAVDGAWEEKKVWDAPPGRKNPKKKSGKSSRRGIGREKRQGCPVRKEKPQEKVREEQ